MAFGLSAGAVSLIGAGVGALGSMGGEGGTQTADRSPWAGAQPWIKSIITAGQGLQDYYTANPFNQGQRQAYGNMAASGDYMRQQIPGFLNTLNGMGGGFDRNNVNARPPAFQFGGGANLGLSPAYGSASQANTADMQEMQEMLKRAQMQQQPPAPPPPMLNPNDYSSFGGEFLPGGGA